MTINSSPTFVSVTGGTGKVSIGFGSAADYAYAVALDDQGRILVAGDSDLGGNLNFALARLNPDGTLDSTFGSGGRLVTDLAGGANDLAKAVLVQADGKIIVAGQANVGGSWNFIAIRYNANGTIDTSYGNAGSVSADFAGGMDAAFSAALQADGKLVLSGYTTTTAGASNFAVARFTTSGTLDTSFNGSGGVTADLAGSTDMGAGMTIQADGKILVVGSTTAANEKQNIAVMRFNANGSLDTSFDMDGSVVTDLGGGNDVAQSVLVQADGKILVAGYSDVYGDSDLVIARYNTDGSIDWNFGSGGTRLVELRDGTGAYTHDFGYSMTLQADGRILVAGGRADATQQSIVLVRFTADGADDWSFNGNGRVVVDLAAGAVNDVARAVTVQPDGKIVVAGFTFATGTFDMAVVRVNADGSLDTRFNGTSVNTLGSSAAYTENGPAVVLDASVQVYDAEMAARGHYSGATLTLARTGGATGQDVFSGSGALLLQGGTALLGGVTIGSYSQANGLLTLTFNANATQARVDQALSSVAYRNTSEHPPTLVQLTWTFSDGTRTGQGTSTVNITRVNDVGTGTVTVSGMAAVGEVLTAQHELADPDGVGPVSWQWQVNGMDIAGATGSTYTLTAGDVGRSLNAVARYTDGGGTVESIASAATAAVLGFNSAPTFNAIISGTGTHLTKVSSGGADIAMGVALQADGKILQVGRGFNGSQDMALARLTADGKLDTSWNGTGIVLTDFTPMGWDTGYAVAVQADGKIVLTGQTQLANTAGYDMALVRYNSDGTLDTTFNGTGKVSTDFGTVQDWGRAIQVQYDGKIVVAGGSGNSPGGSFAVARYNASGTLDTSFNGTGKVTTSMGDSQAMDLAVQADGKIIVVGSGRAASYDMAIVRYNSNGTLDTSFGSNGKIYQDISGGSDAARGVALQTDGKIVVVGSTAAVGDAQNFAIVRYNVNGTLDTTFNGTGKVVVDMGGGSHDSAWKVAIQPDGKIVVSGEGRTFTTGTDFAVLRLTPTGQLDTTFNGTGKVITSLGSTDQQPAVVLQTDGKIVLSGTSGSYDFAAVRYNSNGSLDIRFNGTPVDTLASTTTYPENGSPIALDGAVQVYDAELAALNGAAGNYGGSVLSLHRHGGASAQDVFSGVGNLALANGSATLGGVVIGSYTQQAGTLTLTFNAQTTQARVNEALSNIGYANTSDGPPASLQLLWTFQDGTGYGAKSATSVTTVNIARNNDAPTGAVTISGTPAQGSVLTAGHNLVDPDGLGSIAWQWLANGSPIAGANSATLLLTASESGKTISVRASYTDQAGFSENVTSAATAAITPPNSAPTGSVSVVLPGGATTPSQNHVLTASHNLADGNGMGTITWQWLANGEAIAGANGSTFTLTQAQVGKSIAVRASYTDGIGIAESVTSSATSAVANVNDAPTGGITVSGTARQGQTLTAASTLADADGLGPLSYQWLANGEAIDGATGATLVLGQAQVGKTISVRTSYTDLFGAQESVTSTATTAVANVNDAPTGGVTVAGTATQGQTLTAGQTLADVDGLGTIGYQWLANGAVLAGATGASLVLGQAHVGKTISVRATYTDGQGTTESVTSSATSAVANVNEGPVGTLTIAGLAQQGRTLTASHNLTDEDGMGTVQLQWYANGEAVDSATGTTLVLTQAQVGKAITVTARYTDGFGAQESRTSAATAPVANVNDLPTGGVTIAGNPVAGQTMTVTGDTLADVDGLGAVTYHWIVGGVAVATGSSYTLADADAFKSVLVEAVYSDGQGTTEKVRSGIAVSLGAGNDSFSGATGTDTLQGNAGNDTLTGGAGNDTLDGGGGDGDIAMYSGNGAAYTITTVDGVTTVTHNNGGSDGSDTLRNFEFLRFADVTVAVPGIVRGGTPLADILVGTTNGDTMSGLAGNDFLYGGSGRDSLSGGDDIDVLLGEDGDDVLYGDGGQDYLFGGSGNDTMHGGDGIDVFTAGAGNDVMYGGAGEVDHFYVESGNNTVYGEAGVDILVGGVDADVYYGGADNDYAYAGAGNDSLYGGDGVDVLLGEAGDDFFDPGAGVDYLYLGAGGNDTVLVNAATSGISLLYEFEIGGTNDQVRLQGTGWSSLADVVANTYDYGSFSIVQVDANTAIWIIGAVPAQFTAADFAFA